MSSAYREQCVIVSNRPAHRLETRQPDAIQQVRSCDDGTAMSWETAVVLILAEPKREAVLTRWARAESLGVRAESDAFPVGTSDSDLVVRRDRLEDVFREERALLGPMVDDLAAHSLLAIVADADGFVLAAHGDGSADPAMRVRLVEGACWSEGARGTNAIGTAIVER